VLVPLGLVACVAGVAGRVMARLNQRRMLEQVLALDEPSHARAVAHELYVHPGGGAWVERGRWCADGAGTHSVTTAHTELAFLSTRRS
jgi:hypothetical protein